MKLIHSLNMKSLEALSATVDHMLECDEHVLSHREAVKLSRTSYGLQKKTVSLMKAQVSGQ